MTQTSLRLPIERPGRSGLAFGPLIQDSEDDDDDDNDSSLTILEDNPADEGNVSANASEEGSGDSEAFEVVRRASQETESSIVSTFED